MHCNQDNKLESVRNKTQRLNQRLCNSGIGRGRFFLRAKEPKEKYANEIPARVNSLTEDSNTNRVKGFDSGGGGWVMSTGGAQTERSCTGIKFQFFQGINTTNNPDQIWWPLPSTVHLCHL